MLTIALAYNANDGENPIMLLFKTKTCLFYFDFLKLESMFWLLFIVN